MEENTRYNDCLKFLKHVRERGKTYSEFRIGLNILQEEASTEGLNDIIMKMVIEILTFIDLGSANSIALIKCMIPRAKIDKTEAKKLIAWFLSVSAPVSTLTTLLQWIIGCWEYHIIDRNSIYMFYDAYFYLMLKQDRLESRLAQLIYLITKPEDVTRRQVSRLLKLNEGYRRPQKHIIALLSLFKSYKPEFVPEKIPAINIQSIWRPIPENLRIGFEDARDRIILKQTKYDNGLNYDWHVFNETKTKKRHEPLVPLIGYFNLGSDIFKNKTEKSIFDVSNFEQLGQFQLIVKLPCNATSLLTNVIGYHLLTYADFEYQLRFMHNLYYTFWRSFIFENSRYSDEEMNKVLDMTIEFCRYMQHGISIMNYFINEYLSCYLDEYYIKLLSLIQWSAISVAELQDYVLKHMKLIFYTSSLSIKCKTIRSLRMLLLNLFIINDDSFKNKPFPFLGQTFSGNLKEYTRVIESFAKELLISALNIHFYNSKLISEALSFYEQIDGLEIYKKISFITLAPPAVVYGCFVTKSCASLSRVCALLLQYRKYFKEYKDRSSVKNIKWLIIYAEDLISALWYDNCFSNRYANNRHFLKNLSDNLVKSNQSFNINNLLNICQHYAVLPYLYTLSTSGLQIKTKQDANSVAAHYYSYINQFISALLGN